MTQREAATHGPHHGRLDRAEPLANPACVSGGCDAQVADDNAGRLRSHAACVDGSGDGSAGRPSPPADSGEILPPYAAITGNFVPGGQVGSFDTIKNPEPPKELWRSWAWSGRIVTNDPRLTCDAVINQNADHLEPGWSGGAVRTGINRCENEGGYWAGESVGFTKPGVSITNGNHDAQVLTGHDGYEGLSAVLIWIPSRRVTPSRRLGSLRHGRRRDNGK